jgi:hypothetical protein
MWVFMWVSKFPKLSNKHSRSYRSPSGFDLQPTVPPIRSSNVLDTPSSHERQQNQFGSTSSSGAVSQGATATRGGRWLSAKAMAELTSRNGLLASTCSWKGKRFTGADVRALGATAPGALSGIRRWNLQGSRQQRFHPSPENLFTPYRIGVERRAVKGVPQRDGFEFLNRPGRKLECHADRAGSSGCEQYFIEVARRNFGPFLRSRIAGRFG